jgi:hypothetical protein
MISTAGDPDRFLVAVFGGLLLPTAQLPAAAGVWR